MRCFIFCVLFAGFLHLAPTAIAQEAVRESVEISESGEAYLRAIRLRRIDPDVAYFAPGAPAPNLETDQSPESRPGAREGAEVAVSADSARLITLVIATLIVLLIAYLFFRFGKGLSVSLGEGTANAERNRNARKEATPNWATHTGSIRDILRMPDRRRALVLLTQKVLAATVKANGVLMQRSWTARDALRHIPAKQQHLDLLKTLVHTAESVQFGNRDVSEEDLQKHAASCQRVLGTNSA